MTKLMYAAVIVYGCLAGHVWNSSLSGLIMILAYTVIEVSGYAAGNIQQKKY